VRNRRVRIRSRRKGRRVGEVRDGSRDGEIDEFRSSREESDSRLEVNFDLERKGGEEQ